MAANVEKALLIPHVNVIHPTLGGQDNINAWMVWNQDHLGVIYNHYAPFVECASCTCEWASCKNV